MRKNLLLLVFSVLCIFVVSAKAQQTLGSLNGTVLDPSGAAVGSATVTATDAEYQRNPNRQDTGKRVLSDIQSAGRHVSG